MNTRTNTLQWLLEDENPSVRFRTLTEILGYDDDAPVVRQAKSAVLRSLPVQTLLEKMHPAGYWLEENPRTRKIVGDGVEYGAFGTTHFCLAYLAELGLDRTHPQVEKAADCFARHELIENRVEINWYF